MQIADLLRLVLEKNASDLHLTVGLPPMLRVHGAILTTDYPPMLPEDVEKMIFSMINEEQKEKLYHQRSIDFTYSYIARFRVNIYMEKGFLAAALRIIPFEIPTVQSLKLPNIIAELARKSRGLVLVTGPTGSGKSSTLAAMINLINTEEAVHIITIEDPIEYLHEHKKSIVNQREINKDTLGFSAALRDALRQDPDVILVGEMRDLETISTAITAAETGHLVFATLHTNDAVQTIDRIIDVFPEGQQAQIRMQMSMCLQGVVSQRLLPRADKKGRIAAIEAMTITSAIANLIREKKTHQIYSLIETGVKEGMRSINQSLSDLCRDKIIKIQDALACSPRPESLKRMLL
ncbi:MAG: type IV pilus twitching motility protein PilT [Candidatus Omnitrophota bacterium]